MKFRLFDAFGHSIFIKRILIFVFGIVAWWRFNIINKTKVSGSRHLKNLRQENVLFVSNHQTYFADVVGMYQVFGSAKWGWYDHIKNPLYLLNPKLRVYFVAAKETMKAGILPKLFAYVGSVSIKRSWREAGKDVQRGVDPRDIDNIRKALAHGWVITFPQGTTTPYEPGRRGTAHFIKECKPIVIPVVVDGFRRAFDKKGLFLKKKNTELSLRFKPPLEIDYSQSSKEILEQVMDAIEQSEKFHTMKKIKEEEKSKANDWQPESVE